jgi:hypothetical protein
MTPMRMPDPSRRLIASIAVSGLLLFGGAAEAQSQAPVVTCNQHPDGSHLEFQANVPICTVCPFTMGLSIADDTCSDIWEPVAMTQQSPAPGIRAAVGMPSVFTSGLTPETSVFTVTVPNGGPVNCFVDTVSDCNCTGISGYPATGPGGSNIVSQTVQIRCLDSNSVPNLSAQCDVYVVDNTAPTISCDNQPAGCGVPAPTSLPCTVGYVGCWQPPDVECTYANVPTNPQQCIGQLYNSGINGCVPNFNDTYTCTATTVAGLTGPSAQSGFSLFMPPSTMQITTQTPTPLCPADHNYQTVSLSQCATATDSCVGALDVNAHGRILYVTSNEPENGAGVCSGNTCQDIVLVTNSTVQVRAEHDTATLGRVYTIYYQISDASGTNWSAQQACTVTVPVIGQPPPVGGTCAYCEEAVRGACGTCPGHSTSCGVTTSGGGSTGGGGDDEHGTGEGTLAKSGAHHGPEAETSHGKNTAEHHHVNHRAGHGNSAHGTGDQGSGDDNHGVDHGLGDDKPHNGGGGDVCGALATSCGGTTNTCGTTSLGFFGNIVHNKSLCKSGHNNIPIHLNAQGGNNVWLTITGPNGWQFAVQMSHATGSCTYNFNWSTRSGNNGGSGGYTFTATDRDTGAQLATFNTTLGCGP